MAGQNEMRAQIKCELQRNGWIRMHTRPKDGECVVVAREWIERKYGTTVQFLLAFGIYSKANDSIEVSSFASLLEEIPAKTVHWWMHVDDPTTYSGIQLAAANWFRREMSGYSLYKASLNSNILNRNNSFN